jgi:hypothetical protein
MGGGTIRVGLPSGSSVEVKFSVVVRAVARESLSAVQVSPVIRPTHQ